MSDVLIKGMEMPKNCAECRFCVNGFTDEAPMYECACESYENVSVLVDDNGQPFDFRPEWCPLIELPPHGRLIDVSTVEEIRFHDADGYHVINGEQLCELEIDAPTVIEAEGGRE